jgi:excisionase family DNA binding protein
MGTDTSRRSLLIEDAAVLLGVSRRTVYYRIHEGQLETVRTRGGSQRVLLSSIEQMLRAQRGLPPREDAIGAELS